MKAMLDPKRDLRGATPETLAKALFRRTEPFAPRPGREPVRGREIGLEEVPADQPRNGVAHLGKRS